MDKRGTEISSLAVLLQLARRARTASDACELAFVLVNETFQIAPYRQAALCLRGKGVRALSGVSAPEQNAPFVQWLNRVVSVLEERSERGVLAISAEDIPPELRDGWSEWLPPYALILPLIVAGERLGALLLARDELWQREETALLSEWSDIAAHAWKLKERAPNAASWRLTPSRFMAALTPSRLPQTTANLWRVRWRRYALVAAVVLLLPVRLTVLAPGELVPVSPSVLRAPFDGVVERVLVQPNQRVKSGEALFTLDQTTLRARAAVADQSLVTAEAEYRQQAQLAVFDAKGKSRLADLQGAIQERKAEADYLAQQLERSTITATRDGIVMFEDPSEWIGRPVVTGERIATVANEHDVEVEAWLAPGDLIEMPSRPQVVLYLNTSPLSPVSAKLRYVLYEATQRPDGNFAYRLRAAIEPGQIERRVGLKGTAKVSGQRVPLIYWMLRRPLAAARQLIGF